MLLRGIRHHNLQDLDIDIPLGVLCCVTGVSWFWKSSLVHDVLYRSLAGNAGLYGISRFDEDGRLGPAVPSPEERNQRRDHGRSIFSGANPRSTPAVYIGAYDAIREVFGTHPNALSMACLHRRFPLIRGMAVRTLRGIGFREDRDAILERSPLRCPECEGRRFQPHVLRSGFAIAPFTTCWR